MRCDVQYFLRCTIIALIVLISSNGFGQFNVRVGFNQGFINANTLDDIINMYNTSLEGILEQEMGQLNSMHGINLGLDYKIGNRSIMLHWNNLSKDKVAFGENLDGSFYQEELFYSVNQFLFGLENRFGKIGLGTGIANNQWRIRSRIANTDFKRTLDSGNQWAAHIHLSFNFKSSDNVGFAIIPFIQIPLNDIDVSLVHHQLNALIQNPREDFNLWGIQFVFINGPQ